MIPESRSKVKRKLSLQNNNFSGTLNIIGGAQKGPRHLLISVNQATQSPLAQFTYDLRFLSNRILCARASFLMVTRDCITKLKLSMIFIVVLIASFCLRTYVLCWPIYDTYVYEFLRMYPASCTIIYDVPFILQLTPNP